MSGKIAQLVKDIKIPKMVRIRQCFPDPHIKVEEIPKVILEQLNKVRFADKIQSGMRIAITAGSRGIANIALINKTIVDFVKAQGAFPFIVPAMGSHGGATAEGQTKILHKYGMTEEYLGCPIISSMEVKHIGNTPEGHEVYLDKTAAEADGIIVSCRIKPHTAFTGPIESGIMKMLTIGLGNDYGATICHEIGYKHFHMIIPLFGKTIIENAPVLFAVAAIENAYDHTYKMVAIEPEQVETVEPLLLQEAKSMMPKIMFDQCDVLVVDRIGKNISGAGMDPHITGSFSTPYAKGGIQSQHITVLDLTDESNGNAIGVGEADIITKRLWNKMIPEEGYPNAIVSGMLSTCKIPIVVESDQEAIQVCIKCCIDTDKENPRIIRIKDTLSMKHIMISEALLKEARGNPNIIVESEPQYLDFDKNGNLW